MEKETLEESALEAGLHILVDAKVQDSEVFKRETLEQLFTKLISVLDMKALGEPVFYEVPVDPEILARVQQTGKFEDEGGITGFQVISTSHMSLHAWPLQNFFHLDVFSCKTFDSRLAFSVILESLGVTESSTFVVTRKKPVGCKGPLHVSLG